jgi:hypothetical protein
MDFIELNLLPTNLLKIITSYVGTYGPPINKTLGKEFLYNVVQYLSKNDYIPEKECCIKYMNEDFYIVSMKIRNIPINIPKNIDYKHIWNKCDNSKPLPNECHCQDSDSDSDEDDNDKIDNNYNVYDLYNIYSKYNNKAISFESINTTIKYEGDDVIYISRPLIYSSWAGGQYTWQMVFSYSQPDLNINLVLGPKRWILDKGYTFNYSPICYNKDYFQDDFYLILKNSLINNIDIIEYKNIKYHIIDYKFCKTDYIHFCCGCIFNSCSYMSKEQFITIMPTKNGYRDRITITCTPEWYIQLQISLCNDYSGYSARFILKEL